MDSEEHLEETRRIIFEKLYKRMAEEYGLRHKQAGETECFTGYCRCGLICSKPS